MSLVRYVRSSARKVCAVCNLKNEIGYKACKKCKIVIPYNNAWITLAGETMTITSIKEKGTAKDYNSRGAQVV